MLSIYRDFRSIVLVGGLLIAVVLLARAASAHTTHPCPCRYAGGDVPSGTVVCLTVGGQSSLAVCDMAQNNPTWRILNRPCPIASPANSAKPIG
jgi:hypothetical protein